MRFASLIILAIALIGCSRRIHGIHAAKDPQQASVLSDGEWTLQSIKGESVAGLKKPITLKITTADKRAVGYAGCNQYFSSYTLEGRTISFTSAGRTKMYCKDTMDTEEKFISALGSVVAYRLLENKLLLLHGETVLLEFSK